MAIQKNTCEAEVLLTTIFDEGGGTIQYFVGANPITSVIVVNGGMSMVDVQTLLTNDTTRIMSGYTITTQTPLGIDFTVLISIPSTSQITDFALGEFNGQADHPEAPFNCNLTPIKKRNRGIGVPPTICCNFPDGNCHPQVQYRGYVYQKLPNLQNCYILRKK